MATGELHFTLRQLEYFVAVAETGSISGAATRCHVSQPGLSLAVGQLEESLGVTLFVRSRSKGTTLTTAGIELVDRARNLLADSARFQIEAERESGGVVGRLNIGCYPTLSPSFVPQMLTGFGPQFPGVSLDFIERPQPELQDMLQAGEIELAIMYAHQLDTTLEHTIVQSFRPYVLLSAAHPLAGQEPVSLVDLADDPMILFDVPPSRANWEGLMAHVPSEPVIAHRTQNFELVRCLVGRGIGYSVLFQRPLVDVTYAGDRIVYHEIAEDLPTIDVVLAYPAGVQLTARASLFMQFVSTEFSGKRRAPAG